MTSEVLAPITGTHPVGQEALKYLSSVLTSATIESISSFQKKQQQSLSNHASDLAALLEAVKSAPSEFRPRQMETALVEFCWLGTARNAHDNLVACKYNLAIIS